MIEAHGTHDGYDLERYNYAVKLAGLTDSPVITCFIGLINLEKKGLIKLEDPDKESTDE